MSVSKLKWTAATREQLHHFGTTHGKDPVGAHALPTPSDAWAQIHALTATSRVTASPSLSDALARLQQEFSADEPPAVDAAFELHRVAYVLGQCSTGRESARFADWAPERAVAALLVRGEATSVLDVLVGSAPFWINTGSVWSNDVETRTLALSDQPPSRFAEPPPSFRLSETFGIWRDGLWWALRMHVDALDDAAFAAANAAAHAARRGLAGEASLNARARIALAYARDPSHASEELSRPWPEGVDVGDVAVSLLLASPTIESARRSVDYFSTYAGATISLVAYDLIETFGESAAPALTAACASLEARKMNAGLRKSLLKPLQGALKLIGG